MVTMRDVAAAAGVSVATVSRVLSGNRPVRPEHAAAVRDAVDRLGYRPNQLASALRRQTTLTVGMVVPEIANPFFPGVVEAIEHALVGHRRGLLLCDSQGDPDHELQQVLRLLDRQVDGILIVPCHEQRSAAAVEAALAQVPVVQVDRRVSGVVTDTIEADHTAGIRALVEHLHALGRRRLAFVGADVASSVAKERLEAYRSTGAGGPELLGTFTIDHGQAAARALLDADELPDGVVGANDLIALGVIQGLRAAGVEVPDTVAVTGFDDIGFASVTHPALTTAHQPVRHLGASAVRLLTDRIAGEDGPPRHERVVPSLVVRASTAGGPR